MVKGSIHSGRERALNLVKMANYAEKLNIPCVLINTVYQNNPENYKEYLKKFKLIAVRESNSFNELQKININSLIVPDLTLYSTYNELNKRTNLIGFTDSIFKDITKILYEKSCELTNTIYLSLYADYCASILNPQRINYYFDNIIYKLKKIFSSQAHQDKLFSTPLEYKRKLASLKFLITGRFHSVCFALITKTPFLAIPSNTYKIEGLLYDIGLSNRLITKDQVSLINNESNYEFTEAEIQKIDIFLVNTKNKINALFDKIAELSCGSSN